MAVPDRRHSPLAGSADASGHIWYEVPGYGLVNWSAEQITEQARYLFGLHRPGQASLRVRIVCGFLPLITWPGRYCKVCQTKWLCRTGAWAHDWLGAIAAYERNEAAAAP
jgi:hypothetical protein